MLGRLKTALRALLRRTQVERELDEELRHHKIPICRSETSPQWKISLMIRSSLNDSTPF
jgi:hypothetical protein